MACSAVLDSTPLIYVKKYDLMGIFWVYVDKMDVFLTIFALFCQKSPIKSQ